MRPRPTRRRARSRRSDAPRWGFPCAPHAAPGAPACECRRTSPAHRATRTRVQELQRLCLRKLSQHHDALRSLGSVRRYPHAALWPYRHPIRNAPRQTKGHSTPPVRSRCHRDPLPVPLDCHDFRNPMGHMRAAVPNLTSADVPVLTGLPPAYFCIGRKHVLPGFHECRLPLHGPRPLHVVDRCLRQARATRASDQSPCTAGRSIPVRQGLPPACLAPGRKHVPLGFHDAASLIRRASGT